MITKELNAGKNVLPKLSEDDLQAQAVTWFRTQYKHLYWRFYSIPNSGKRNIVTAANMKRTGALSGVWDLFLSVPKGDSCGMYIEMKVGKNKLTENQIEFMSANSKCYSFSICNSLEDFKKRVDEYLNWE